MKAQVQINAFGAQSWCTEVQKGVRQGSLDGPDQFNTALFYALDDLVQSFEEREMGFTLGRQDDCICVLLYADNIYLVSNSIVNLGEMARTTNERITTCGMEIKEGEAFYIANEQAREDTTIVTRGP